MKLCRLSSQEVPAGTGSGFVWDKLGHIVTNYHVIRNAESARISITGVDGKTKANVRASGKSTNRSFESSIRHLFAVVGVDPDKDVAVLAADISPEECKKLRPVELGTSNTLKVGQSALAIGNPFGLDHTLTTGVVSGLGREVKSPSNRPISNVIQTG